MASRRLYRYSSLQRRYALGAVEILGLAFLCAKDEREKRVGVLPRLDRFSLSGDREDAARNRSRGSPYGSGSWASCCRYWDLTMLACIYWEVDILAKGADLGMEMIVD